MTACCRVGEEVSMDEVEVTPAQQKGMESEVPNLTHLTNSWPTLSLCMTGRGECLGGGRGDKKERRLWVRSTALHRMRKRRIEAGTRKWKEIQDLYRLQGFPFGSSA